MKKLETKEQFIDYISGKSVRNDETKIHSVVNGGVYDKEAGYCIGKAYKYSVEGESYIAFIGYSLKEKKFVIACGHPHFWEEPSYPKHEHEIVNTLLDEVAGTYQKQPPCHYNIRLSKTGQVCKHLSALFYHIDSIEELVEDIDKLRKETKKKKSKSGDNLLETVANVVAFKGRAIAMVGPAGTGKSKSASMWAEKIGAEFIKFDCTAEHESLDLFAQLTYAIDGSKIWKNGPIAQAALLAKKGKKVVLFLDEFLNLPKRTQGALKAGFEPDKGKYRFETGRALPDGTSEVIEIPVENLQIIAAANTGDGYSSYEFERALKQRFFVIDYRKDWQRIKKVLEQEAKKKGFSQIAVTKLLNFGKSIDEYYQQDALADECSLRQLLDILRFSESEEDLADVARLHKYQWIDFEAEVDEAREEMEEEFESIVEKTLE